MLTPHRRGLSLIGSEFHPVEQLSVYSQRQRVHVVSGRWWLAQFGSLTAICLQGEFTVPLSVGVVHGSALPNTRAGRQSISQPNHNQARQLNADVAISTADCTPL